MKKETAVEWLVKELFPNNEIFGISNALIYQAKEMEEQQKKRTKWKLRLDI
jgi:hypothetical protein